MKRSSRRSGVFPEVQVCVSECFSGPRRVFRFVKNRDFSPRLGPKKSSMSQTFEQTVLGSYFTKIYDILTKWILKTHSMWETCVQILYRSINNSKIDLKYTKPIDWMGRIRTAYLLCTRITLETTALRVMCIDGVTHWRFWAANASHHQYTWLVER